MMKQVRITPENIKYIKEVADTENRTVQGQLNTILDKLRKADKKT